MMTSSGALEISPPAPGRVEEIALPGGRRVVLQSLELDGRHRNAPVEVGFAPAPGRIGAYRIKRELGRGTISGSTWVAGYTNDVMAYIPSRRVLTEGRYEGATSMIYYGLPSPWAPMIEEAIMRTVRAQAGK